jgi:iron complex outermembrane receptor protein
MKNQANKKMRAIALSATLSFAAAGYASQACAQSAAPSSNSAVSGKAEEKFFLEEIIVTAQKRAQSAEDVAIAMSVLGSDMLEKANVSNVTDLVGLVPSVQANYGAGQVVFNVRGIGTNEFAGNLDSPIAVNVDEVYMSKSFMTGLLLFDMDRIEVLKGPQGTLFGRNATGGAVNFYTRKPSQDTEIGQTISYDNYQTIRSETYVNGAISENLSGRLSALVVDQGKGYYRNITKGRREAEEKKQAVRGQLQYDNGNTTALFTVGGGRQKGTLTPYEGVGILTPASVAAGAPAFCAAYLAGRVTGSNNGCVRGTDGRNPGDDNPFTSTNNSVHDVDNKSFMTSLRVDHDFGSVDLTVLSSYNYFWRRQNEDADGGPTDTIDLFYNQKIKQMTHELRLAGGAGPAWNYMVGAYFERDWFKNGDYAETARGTAPSIYSPFDQEVTALAFFANSDYAVNDEVTLIQGFRYSREKIAFKGGTDLAIGATGFPPRPTTTIARLSYADDTRSDDAATFKVGVEWRPVIRSDFVDKILVYGNVSTGFRSGGYSATFATTQASLTSLSPEKITAYELGFKSVLDDRKLQINAAAFRYQFEDG